MGVIVLKQDVDKAPLSKIPSDAFPSAEVYNASFITSEDTFATLSAGITEFRKGSFDWHYMYDEFIYGLDGEVTWKDLDTGKTYTVREGDMLYIGKNTRANVSTKTGAKSIWCSIPPFEATVPDFMRKIAASQPK